MPTRSMNELETDKIQAMLESMHWDPPVHAWRVESDIDSLGDQALWVWVVYDVEEVDLEAAHQAERKIQSLISDAGDERWVYVRFRTREEDADTDEDDEDETGWPDDLNESPVVG